MNLVVSGPASPALLTAIERLSRPSKCKRILPDAWRLENVDDSERVRVQITAWCSSAFIDHAYVEPGIKFSDMKLLALDMDSTLITIECIDELADFAGKRSEVAAITEATMRGEIDNFSESLRSRAALLNGLDVDVLRRVFEERLRLSLGAQALIDAAHQNNLYLLLVSGGFTYFADRLRAELHLDAAFANRLEASNGKLTGRIVGDIIDGPLKAAKVQDAMRLTHCGRTQAIVIGDGVNDVQMMQCVKYSVAYHAKVPVQRIARFHIHYGSLLTTLAYFE